MNHLPNHPAPADAGSLTRTAVLASVCAFVLLGSLAGCTPSGGPPDASTQRTPPSQPEQPEQPDQPEQPRTSAVPAPDGTTIDDVIDAVAPGPVENAELDEVVALDSGVEISVTEIRGLSVEAVTPGEVAGPAVAATIRFENDSGEPLDVGNAMVSLVDAAGNVAPPTTSEPAAPAMGTLDDGGAAEGIYVFLVPEDTRNDITLTVTHSAGSPIAVFHGPAR